MCFSAIAAGLAGLAVGAATSGGGGGSSPPPPRLAPPPPPIKKEDLPALRPTAPLQSIPVPDMPYYPDIPTPVEFKEFTDYITGTKAQKSIDAQGKTKIDIVKIRSPEEQNFINELKRTLTNSIQIVNQVLSRNPSALPDFMPFLNNMSRINDETIRDLREVGEMPNIEEDVKRYRDMSNRFISERFEEEMRRTENALAERGLDNSSLGRKEMNAVKKRFDRAITENDWYSLQYGEDLAYKRQQNRLLGFQARQTARNAQTEHARTAHELKRQGHQDELNERERALREGSYAISQASELLDRDDRKSRESNVGQHALDMYKMDNILANEQYEQNLRHAQMQDAANWTRWQASRDQEFDRFKTEYARNSDKYNQDLNEVIIPYNTALGVQQKANQTSQEQYAMEVDRDRYNKSQPTVGSTLLNMGGMLAGGMLFGPSNSGAGRLFNRLTGI